jgi:penicillin-binding protein 2
MAAPSRSFLADKSGWGIADPGLIKRRAWMGAGFLFLAFGGLLARLWFLQVVKGDEMLALAAQNRIRQVPLTAPRGLILDRNSKVLATSRVSHSVAVVPAALPSAKRDPEGRAKVLQTLGFLLSMSPAQIEAKITAARERGAHIYDPIRIVEEAPYKTLTLIEENKPRLGPAVLVTDDVSRNYPNGALAAHVLGYTGAVTAEDLERNRTKLAAGEDTRELGFDDVIGKSGVERQYDRPLTGERGSEQYEVDSRLRPVRRLGSIAEKPGNTLQLTLDVKLQKAAEDALRKARNSGAVAAVDVRTGEILALASNPTFNPNLFSLRGKAYRQAYLSIVKNQKHPLINRAVSSRFPPGSTFKMITAAAALEKGVVNPNTAWHCGGGLKLGGFFGCWNVHGPNINVRKALQGSCNVYFYQSALKMGNPEGSGPTYLAQVARRFGLGKKTGVDLPTDAAGLIPDPEWRREYHDNKPQLAHWYPGNTLNMSIGQGDVLASPLQMALVTAAVANGRYYPRPHLLKAVLDSKNRPVQVADIKRTDIGISDQTMNLVRQGMRDVVTKGTGKAVALKHVAVAGKTGSSEDANHTLPHAWFVAFAPYDKPRIAIAVIVENSGHGSENAVPVTKAILEAAFPEPKATSTSAP